MGFDNINDFSVEKSLQILSYLQNKLKAKNYFKLLKHVFFAERYHLRKYCTPILNDNFVAMKNGPVASKLYNVIKKDDFFLAWLDASDRELIENCIDCDRESGNVTVSMDTDYDLVSESEKEALDFSIQNFGRFGKDKLIRITHQYPEWEKVSEGLGETVKMKPMSYVEFFSNPNAECLERLGSEIGRDPFESEYIEETKCIFCQAD